MKCSQNLIHNDHSWFCLIPTFLNWLFYFFIWEIEKYLKSFLKSFVLGHDFTKIAVSKSCKDKHVYKGYIKTADLCADECYGSSTVFVYGKTSRRCNSGGCACWCITGATRGGTCLKPYSHSYFDTYRLNGNLICYSYALRIQGVARSSIIPDLEMKNSEF